MSGTRGSSDFSEEPFEDSLEAAQPWARVTEFFLRLTRYYLLYFIILAAFLAYFAWMYAVTQPVYVAVAMVGPPNPSPTNSLRANVNGGGSTTASSFTNRILGGAGGGGNDPFQEYQQLLHSSRLANELAEKDKLLPVIFHSRWNAATNSWRPRGGASSILASVKQFFNRPVADHPDAASLQTFLNTQLDVSPVSNGRAALLAGSTMYVTTALTYGDPKEAERILGIILNRADDVIRQEQLRDVLARISYIRAELPKVTENDYRGTLIDTLSGQEQLQIMMVADQKYAVTMVDTPHTLPDPVSPMKPISAFLIAIILSFGVLCGLVYLAPGVGAIRKVIGPFERKARGHST